MTELSYIQMLSAAKKLDSTSSIKNIDGEWYVIIPTNWVESTTLDDSLKGTPADEALSRPDETYGSALRYWAVMNGLRNAPLHVIAVYYNLNVARTENMHEYIKDKAASEGVDIPTEFDQLMDLDADKWAVITGWYDDAVGYATTIYREGLLEAIEKYGNWLNA